MTDISKLLYWLGVMMVATGIVFEWFVTEDADDLIAIGIIAKGAAVVGMATWMRGRE